MKIAHLSDLHIGGSRIDDHAATLRAVIDAALEESPDLWLVTGDLYGRTVPHLPTPAEREVLEPQIVRMAAVAPVVILQGNHDHAQALERAKDLAGRWPISVSTKAEILNIRSPGGPVIVYCLPYPTKRWLLEGEEAAGREASQESLNLRLDVLLGLWRTKIARQRQGGSAVQILAAHLQVAGSTYSGGEVLATAEIEITKKAVADLGVDYGAFGHLHANQEIALRCWYVGSLWRNDFSERDAKGWHLVEVEKGGTRIKFVPSPCRDFVTLDWRWGADRTTGEPRWIERPPMLERIYLEGAEVRCRLVVPDSLALSVPWEDELAIVRSRGAYRLQVERTIEPTVRARVPELARATTNAERLRLYWSHLESPPELVEQAEALRLLEDLERGDNP